MDVVRVLWFVAGAAMLLFVAFLGVLTLAAIGFRLGPRALRQRPALVFGAAAVLVVVAAAVLLFPTSSLSVEAQSGAPVRQFDVAGAAVRSEAGKGAIAGTPMRYSKHVASGRAVAPTTTRSLILYDNSGPDPANEELNATLLANLVSHFGTWTAHPVGTYQPGEAAGYSAVFYLGAPGGPEVPGAFLDDAVRSTRPVVWIDGDVDQLHARRAAAGYGFTVQGRDAAQFARMEYKNARLSMDPDGGAGFTRVGIVNPAAVTVLATGWRADGSSVPWALRSGNLIFLSENPLPYQGHLEGRNLAFADILFEALDPAARSRHRALVRLEDINPTTDPGQLRAVVDYLAGRGVPFSFGVYPVFRDPKAAGGTGTGVTIRLTERPALVSVLKYAITRGGTLVLHGYTHQYAAKNNPSNGRSGDDAEFYLCHLDEQQVLRLDGHVPEDSPSWALSRFDQALAEVQAAGLPRPTTFEFPHYMASAVDYLATGARFTYRYERSLYFPGFLSDSDQPANDSRPRWQMFPYAVRDVYGSIVIPENLDYVSGDPESVTQKLNEARENLVVRDGVASFFYHPMLGVGQLPRLVEGLQALGYTFVPGREVTTPS